jgi:hypothetical protein
MLSINPDEVIVEDDGTDVDLNTKMINQRWIMKIPDQGGIAYIRITPQLRDFIKLCHEKHGIIGFEYDLDDIGLNLGIVLKKSNDETI